MCEHKFRSNKVEKSPQCGIRQCEHTLLHPVVAYTHCLVQLGKTRFLAVFVPVIILFLSNIKNKSIIVLESWLLPSPGRPRFGTGRRRASVSSENGMFFLKIPKNDYRLS